LLLSWGCDLFYLEKKKMKNKPAPVLKQLTYRQRKVYAFVCNRIRYGFGAPTLREIADFMSFKSHHTVVCHLKLIEKKGYIRLIPGKHRGIEIYKPNERRRMSTKKDSAQVCAKCGALVIWLEIQRKDGKRLKHIFNYHGSPVAILSDKEKEIYQIKVQRLSHWATCPRRDEWIRESKQKQGE